MKILKNPGLPSEIKSTHTFAMYVKDTMGRKWKFGAYPKSGGVICFFNTITELKNWIREVVETRGMVEGKLTLQEKMHNHQLANSFCY